MIRIVTVGTLPAPYDALVEEYRTRISPFEKIELLRLREEKLRKDASNLVEKRARETRSALEHAAGRIIILDEYGRDYTSKEFSDMLEDFRSVGETVTFLIGGSHGFDRTQLRGLPTLRLSHFTLLHHMALLILMEGIYRAQRIRSGSTYHK